MWGLTSTVAEGGRAQRERRRAIASSRAAAASIRRGTHRRARARRPTCRTPTRAAVTRTAAATRWSTAARSTASATAAPITRLAILSQGNARDRARRQGPADQSVQRLRRQPGQGREPHDRPRRGRTRFVDFLVSKQVQDAVDAFPTTVDPAFHADAFPLVTLDEPLAPTARPGAHVAFEPPARQPPAGRAARARPARAAAAVDRRRRDVDGRRRRAGDRRLRRRRVRADDRAHDELPRTPPALPGDELERIQPQRRGALGVVERRRGAATGRAASHSAQALTSWTSCSTDCARGWS